MLGRSDLGWTKAEVIGTKRSAVVSAGAGDWLHGGVEGVGEI